MNQPLLSICIPTYNRANVLRETVQTFIDDPDFDEQVEIVILDNASTDATQSVGEELAAKCSNVKYYRNLENIEDKNFFSVLKLGTGKYLKLNNDTITLRAGGLRRMKEHVACANPNQFLFFFPMLPHLKREVSTIRSINDLIEVGSFYITSIACFGCWKNKLEEIVDPFKYSSFKLTQVDWYLQLANNYEGVIIHSDDVVIASLPNKGGYNIAQVFVNNYFSILNDWKAKISNSVLEKEKFRIFKYHILPLTKQLYGKSGHTFDKKKHNRILYTHYKDKPYFYFFYIRLFLMLPYVLLRKYVRQVSGRSR
ncbi:MAG: glycosyltransferase family 2 protein [Phocaeicola sp.]